MSFAPLHSTPLYARPDSWRVPAAVPVALAGDAAAQAAASGTLRTAVLSATTTTLPLGGTVDLSAEGSADWAHFGLNGLNEVNRKAGVTSQIGSLSFVGGTPTNYEAIANRQTYNWSDGTPTASASTRYLNYVYGVGNGFELEVDADTTERTALVYLGGWQSRGCIESSLSDGSAPDVSTCVENLSDVYDERLAINYRAASGGQTLTLRYLMESGTGNVSFQAAALQTSALAELTGDATAQSAASGALGVTVPITGAAVSQATATGSLSTSVPISGAATVSANADGTLSASIPLSGAALASAGASGALSVQVRLSGAALASALGSGALTVSTATTEALSGAAAASASAAGALRTQVPLSGASLAASSADGTLITLVPLAGAAASVSTGTGTLDVSFSLSGDAAATAAAAATLTARVQLAGDAVASALGAGTLLEGAPHRDAAAARVAVVPAEARRRAA